MLVEDCPICWEAIQECRANSSAPKSAKAFSEAADYLTVRIAKNWKCHIFNGFRNSGEELEGRSNVA